VHRDPRRRAAQAQIVDQRVGPAGGCGRDVDRQALVGHPTADASNQIELATHLVANAAGRLGIDDPVGQELIGVLVTVSQPPRNAGQEAQHRRRQRALAVDGEDRRRLEAPRRQLRDHPDVGHRVGTRRGGLHPRRLVDHDAVDAWEQARGGRPGRRRQQCEPAARPRGLERAQSWARHHDVAERVEAHGEHAGGVGPARRHHAILSAGPRSRTRSMIELVDRSSTYGRMCTMPPSSCTIPASGMRSSV
jgi:hypothetical protein